MALGWQLPLRHTGVAGVAAHWASAVQPPPGTQRRAAVSQTRFAATRVQSALALQPGTQVPRDVSQ
ncbi:MAG: hypothetical protein IPN17_03005 [Deltaproteobacteria bacterium]|nr:hypothetical protein [Deltaproteobacteria bacterium]